MERDQYVNSRDAPTDGVDGPLTALGVKMVVVKDHQQREPSMGDIATIGLDLAKNVFQVHAVDAAGNVVVRKRLRRGQVLVFFAGIPSCLVGLKACATAHHWAQSA
jgi:hypothetical protein